MVLIHGSGHTHESFEAQTRAFAQADAVSLPGHPEGRALQSIADCADWVAKYLRWKGVESAVVGGNSLGGAVALEFALRYPEKTAGLVLIGAGARLRVSPEIFQMLDTQWPDCIETLAKWSVSPDAPAELFTRLREWHLAVGQDSTRQDYRSCDAFDVMDRVASIRTRALIIVGAADKMTPPKYSSFLHERIAGSELALIEGAGHMPHAEKPDAVNDLVRATFGEVLA